MEKIKLFEAWLAEKATSEDIKKLKDIMTLPYEKFVEVLKDNAKDPKVQAILNMGKEDGLAMDEKVKVNDTAAFACKDLIPTQSQIGLADSLSWLGQKKPEAAGDFIKGNTHMFDNNRILTANGKYILDGHHRWSQVCLFNPDAKIPAVDLSIPGLDEKDLLRVVQVAIAATYKDVFMKPANSETDIFDESKMSDEKMRAKLPELLGEKMTEIAKKAYGFSTDEEVYEKIVENAQVIKEKKPKDAPARDFMPQPGDTAKQAGRTDSETKDFKGIPGEFIDKLKSGNLNFKSPLKKGEKK